MKTTTDNQKRWLRCFVGFAVCAMTFGSSVVSVAVAQNPSLWQRRDQNMENLFADVKARRPGDLLFVSINEQSDVDNRDQRLLNKQNSSSSDASGTYGVGGGLGTGVGNLNFDQESAANRSFNGNTQFRSERGFSDHFTVEVVDVLPNGNLLITGKRNVSLEGDSRVLVLTGMVRGPDVSPNNLISSRLVANLSIRYEADGQVGPEQKFINQGWLGKKFNRIWPH
jgi:flagellar L-ring protein precursor FlgH